jgi:hypothetical protein
MVHRNFGCRPGSTEHDDDLLRRQQGPPCAMVACAESVRFAREFFMAGLGKKH